MHGAIATNRGEGCIFCSQIETLAHLFVLFVEHSYHQMMDNVQTFSFIWAVERALCSDGEEGELIVNLRRSLVG